MTNVLVIMSDDHARSAVGCYGNPVVQTPSIDYLSATGVRMSNAFTPTPVCSPSRASFWTGTMPSQHGVHDYLAEADPEVVAHPWMAGCATLADLFKANGYRVGLSGKWHLGDPTIAPASFDYWFCTSAPVPNPAGYKGPDSSLVLSTKGYNRQLVTDHAIEFLRNRESDQPFFLYVGYIATHSPWGGHPERLVDQYRNADLPSVDDAAYKFGTLAGEARFPSRADQNEALAQYYGAASEIDEQVGRLLDELDAQQVREETLVVYTSDHGLLTGQYGLWGKGNCTRPYNMLDDSIRIPMILNHPGEMLPGHVRAEMVTHCDLFETIVDHAGIDVPAEVRSAWAYPGRSFRGLCRGIVQDDWPDEVFGEYGPTRMIRTERFKLVRRYPDGPCELFDLSCPDGEVRNLFDEAEFAAVVDEMTDRLDRYFSVHSAESRSGLRVAELWRHNVTEMWRDSGEPELVIHPTWIADMATIGLDEAE